jgi:hypothetical protein
MWRILLASAAVNERFGLNSEFDLLDLAEGAQATIHEALVFASFLIDSNSPKINVGRQTVPVVERVGIIRFVAQLVVPRRQSDLHINFSVLTCTTRMCSLGLLHLPHT